MNRLRETVDVALPPEQVFAFATDFSSFPVWQTGVRSARPEGGGQVAEGSTARVERRSDLACSPRQSGWSSWLLPGVGSCAARAGCRSRPWRRA